ncbi:MAG: hypothetical protein K2K44_03525, partial [Oscillospiraceae bacterium]|nr:hypothetical protein [Oscillospiraceae bacterium]
VKPAPEVEPKPEPVAEVKPAPVAEPKPEPVAEVKPAPAAEPPKKTNSYMELFAKKRRASAEEAPKSEEPAVSAPVQQAAEIPAPKPEPAPVPVPKSEPVPAPAPIPRPGPTPEADLDFGDLDFGAAASVPAPAPAPVPQPAPAAPAASNELDLDSYDFIGDSKPAVSSRALNAVQALAKAKEDAEKEAAQKAAERTAEQESSQNNYNDAEEQGFEMSADDDDGIIVEASAPADYEEESDGLEAFEFTNDIDYDVEAELDIKFVEPEAIEPVKHESKNNLDIKKLQEEINASIESNRAAKEKMMARYSKKKEEVHNPFAVQFDEEEDKKKKKKKAAPEPKFLEDPIDPDIFFSKPSKGMDLNSDSMPEIKFKH